MINPLKAIEINSYRLWHPKVTPAQHGLQIAQISDVHLGRWVKPRHMAQVVEYVNKRRPDLVALTGDYVGYNSRDLSPATATLGGLEGPTFAVLGNHDHWTSTEAALEGFQAASIPVLTNENRVVETPSGILQVVGVDDHVTKKADVDKAFEGVEEELFCLVLNHVPSLAPDIAPRGADLILSGHTHGYQFNIPGVTNRIAQSLGAEYHVGAYFLDGAYLYINRGLGSASWPWRIGAQPELSFFELAHGPRPRLELLESTIFGVNHRPR